MNVWSKLEAKAKKAETTQRPNFAKKGRRGKKGGEWKNSSLEHNNETEEEKEKVPLVSLFHL